MSSSYTVKKGKRYAARVDLGLVESFVDNEEIVKRLVDAGFVDVKVTGSGSERIAHGTWTKDDATGVIPHQVTEIKELA